MEQNLTLPAKKGNPRKPLPDAEDKDLVFWSGRITENLASGASNWPDKDRTLLAGIHEEMKRRGLAVEEPNAQAPRQQPQQRPPAQQQARPQPNGTALATRPPESLLAGAVSDAASVTARLAQYSKEYHLVSPATRCDALPPGCGVALSLVMVNPDTNSRGPGEVFGLPGGKVGLAGTTLKRIGAAAGVDWDPMKSGRLDSGRDAHYCHFRAVGYVKNFDGSIRTLTGEVEIDMREGSPQVVAMYQRAKEQSNADAQLRDTRLFILRHAETKAKLRAIADMGIKRSYTVEELQKPFAVARLMWTGETKDPELKREFARMHAAAMIGGAQALYGASHQSAALPQFVGHDAPPVGAVNDDLGDVGGYDYDAHGEPAPASEPKNQQAQTADAAAQTQTPPAETSNGKPPAADPQGDAAASGGDEQKKY